MTLFPNIKINLDEGKTLNSYHDIFVRSSMKLLQFFFRPSTMQTYSNTATKAYYR